MKKQKRSAYYAIEVDLLDRYLNFQVSLVSTELHLSQKFTDQEKEWSLICLTINI